MPKKNHKAFYILLGLLFVLGEIVLWGLAAIQSLGAPQNGSNNTAWWLIFYPLIILVFGFVVRQFEKRRVQRIQETGISPKASETNNIWGYIAFLLVGEFFLLLYVWFQVSDGGEKILWLLPFLYAALVLTLYLAKVRQDKRKEEV